ncbi:MAG TPA: hypothetical protein VKY89_22575, partial [Thermoanaerobaculia bacterium]|nr:hypothetical protein [Thermoanaerobaculia bacterium]
PVVSAAARDAVIQQHLQTLKLPAFRRSYEALASPRDGGDVRWSAAPPALSTGPGCSRLEPAEHRTGRLA